MPSAKQLLKAWLIAGTMDISAACLQYYLRTGKGPAGVLRFVAGGLLGPAAFNSKISYVPWLGLAVHYGVAFFWAGVLFLALRTSAGLRRLPWWWLGTGYGILVFALMTFVVVPLTALPSRPIQWERAWPEAIILIVCIGWPMAWVMNRRDD